MEMEEQNTSLKKCIICTNVPLELLQKLPAKKHFRKFGRIVRLLLRSKSQSCTIEYDNEESAMMALTEAAIYNGQRFSIVRTAKSPKKKLKKDPDPDWIPDPDVQAELEAMGNYQYNLRPEGMIVDQIIPETPKRKERKIKRTWKAEIAKNVKYVDLAGTSATMTIEQTDLFNILKQPAFTAEEKYRVLEARDKLIRLRTKRHTDLTHASPTVGACPDMCPEKERLMRETQHQVALYEQEPGGRSMNHTLAVKQYSRSSADQEVPLPHELRPVSVLQLTMSYLMHQIMTFCDSSDVNFGEWYHFLWDRTRGIRKDITQQELCCQSSVQLVEQCARFHIHCSARLVAEDPSVFDQKINTENLTKCLQTLKYMYHDLDIKGEVCPNEAEFRAYIILLNLNDGNFMWDVQQLKPHIQKSPQIQFALKVYSALDKNNYVKFFKLVHSTSYLNACLLLRYFNQVRICALGTILKCYSPRSPYTQFPISELKDILAFEDISSTVDFLEYYGLYVNEEKIHVTLDRKLFSMPQVPYTLDRCINVIESKKKCSVGEIVCGQTLPMKEFEKYIPKSSFDEAGYINIKEFLPDIDISLTQSEPYIETPKEIKSNESTSAKKPNVFQSNLFKQDQESRSNSPLSIDTVDEGAIKSKSKLWSKPDEMSGKSEQNKFLQNFSFNPVNVSESIFPNVHPKSYEEIQNKSIFGNNSNMQVSNRIFGGSNTNSSVGDKPKFPTQTKGGFYFELSKTQSQPTQNSKFEGQQKLEDMNLEKLEEEKARIENSLKMDEMLTNPGNQNQLEIEERIKIEEEEKVAKERHRLEEERRKVLAKRLEEKRKEEEKLRKDEEEKIAIEKARLKKVEEKRRSEEQKRIAEIKRIEDRRKMEIEKQKEREIKLTVKIILDDVLIKVEENSIRARLEEISNNIRQRKMKKVLHKWRDNIIVNKKKRKAVDQWPIWVNSKTAKEEACDLYKDNQEETLKYMKRYKSGVPIEFDIIEENVIDKIDLFKLTHKILLKNLTKYSLQFQHNIYWKVNISLPNSLEMRTGLTRLEKTLCNIFQWESKQGSCMLLEQHKQLSNKVTYCIKKHESSDSTNGFIFIGDVFTDIMYKRITKSVESVKRNSSVPAVIILQDKCYDEMKMFKLVDKGYISDYKVISNYTTKRNMIDLIKEALLFLAKNIKPAPPLELDTFQSFLQKYLATEIWKRVTSFTKWNHPYKLCLSNPKVAFNLYNEAVDRLEAIIIKNDSRQYADFPDIFINYLPNKIPNFLPCDYKYFPSFWKQDSYNQILKNKLDDLKLPQFETRWPPKDERELQTIIYDFCVKFFDEPQSKFSVVMKTILKNFNPEDGIDGIQNVLWSDIIEVLAMEKLNELDFSLRGSLSSQTVFNELIVVYNTKDLQKYNEDMWFYLDNPNIKKEIDISKQKIENERTVYFDMDYDFDFDKTIADLNNYSVQNEDNLLEGKLELKKFETLLNDLEDSMAIQKKISSKFEETLKLVLDDK